MIDLRFDRVSKKYQIRQEAEKDESRGPFVRKVRDLWRRSEEFWAVRDVSFEVRRGEALGIIGHNGAGKSTILKLLSNITAPTSGQITINGRLAALIEVGSGFHPELTGRENVYLSGSILGMRRLEISKKLESIIEFAGIRRFIDTPVKWYSSGMYVRLGFSIAAHLEPDILLLDEVLAVGDAAFQMKCQQRIKQLEEDGTTIVFISHDLSMVERLCDHVILLERGQVVARGEPAEVIKQYEDILPPSDEEEDALQLISEEEFALQLRDEEVEHKQPLPQSLLDEDVIITSIEMFGADGSSRCDFNFGEEMRIKIDLHASRRVESPVVNFGILNGDNVIVCNFNNWYDNIKIDYIEGACSLEGWLPPLRLIPGLYETSVIVAGEKEENGSTKMRPLAMKNFGGFSIHGPALTNQDGVFQQPVRKWVLFKEGQQIEYDDITADSLYEAFEAFEEQKDLWEVEVDARPNV